MFQSIVQGNLAYMEKKAQIVIWESLPRERQLVICGSDIHLIFIVTSQCERCTGQCIRYTVIFRSVLGGGGGTLICWEIQYIFIRWVPCDHSMVSLQILDTGEGLQIWKLAENILHKQLWTAKKRQSFSMGIGWGAYNSLL
jgi:hypothetical protein